MSRPRLSLVVVGKIVVAAGPGGLETAEALGIEGGRVVVAGSRAEVLATAGPGVRTVEAGDRAVVPGLHDAHLHLVWLARARREVDLDPARDFGEVVELVASRAPRLDPGAWLTGRGWNEASLDQRQLGRLEAAVGERPAMLTSHDGHSVWASAAARRIAGIGATTPDPPGGRIERAASGEPNGILRETARELVSRFAGRLQGEALASALRETLAELHAWGITGATDAGDLGVDHGVGRYAELGDSFSSLAELAAALDGRLRLDVNLPAEAIAAAAALGARTAAPLAENGSLRVGWAKFFADGALGSRTAALIEPYSCGDALGTGLLRVEPEQLTAAVAAGRRAGIASAIHVIGDRAAAVALDALAAAPAASGSAAADRLEHAQLMTAADRERLARVGAVASMQPIHAAADRHAVEACWAGRQADAFAWRSLLRAGAVLAFGSDAPVESANPWAGMFAAVHRRFAGDGEADWRPEQGLTLPEALAAYTLGPATSLGVVDEGHLRPGARADLAVVDCDLATLLAADERLAAVRAELTLVGGREVHRS